MTTRQENLGWLRRLQKRWGVNSVGQVLVILLVFALTGFSSLYAKRFIYPLIGITPETSVWVRTVVWFILILPLYQVLLLAYGTLLGQFTFFWNFEKRMFKGLARLVGIRL